MDNTEADDPRRLLSKLTSQERKVLELRCEGKDYKAIGKQLSVTPRTVKEYMKNIYIKLDLDYLSRTEKESQLLLRYSPLIHLLEVPPKAENEKVTSGPMPNTVKGMVEEDESIHPGDVEEGEKSKNTHENPKGGSGVKLFGFLVVGVVIGVCISAVIVLLVLRPILGTIPFFIQPTSVVQSPTPKITETQVQTSTMALTLTNPITILADTVTPSPISIPATIPTATEIPPTDTTVPSPTPAITLPFTDNFDKGASPLWEIQGGNWAVINGVFMLTSGSGWIFLDEPTLKNYRLTLDLYDPCLWKPCGLTNEIAVRVSREQGKFFGIVTDWEGKTMFSYFDINLGSQGIGEWSGAIVQEHSTISIEAIDNHFTYFVNGSKIKDIFLDGFPSGGIGFGTGCNVECAGIDNVKVEPLP